MQNVPSIANDTPMRIKSSPNGGDSLTDPDELLSAKQAAKIIGISLRRMQEVCASKQIPYQRVGKVFVIRRGDAEAFALKVRPVGRPAKKPDEPLA